MIEVLKHVGVWMAVLFIIGWFTVSSMRRKSPDPFDTILKAAAEEKRQKAPDADEPGGGNDSRPSALDL